MSFKKALPFKKAVAFAGAATLLLGVSSLSAYEQDWSDKQLGPDENNSWFKVNGQIWAAYEFKDKKADNSTDYSGFKVGRAVLNLQGEGTKGAAEGFGYRLMFDVNTTMGSAGITGVNAGSTLTAPTGSAAVYGTNVNSYYNGGKFGAMGPQPPTPFMKYAYFQVPVPGVKGTFIRAGFQPMPTVDGQAGASMEGIWGHRYLDADGKAIWEELGASPSSDGGLGFIHKNDLFGIHLVLSNGPGYTNVFGANGGYANVSGIGNAAMLGDPTSVFGFLSPSAAWIGKGNGESWGLDLFGDVSLTPLKSKDDGGLDLTIQFPFRFKNIQGVNRQEYNGVYNLDFTNLNQPGWTAYSGSKDARKDKTYGVEVDAKLKLSATSAITLGGGTVRMVDNQSDAIIVTSSNYSLPVETFLAGGNYYYGAQAVGKANYVFAHGKFGPFGFVARLSQGTGTGALSENMGTAVGNPLANETAQNVGNLISSNSSNVESGVLAIIKGDRGLAKFTKKTVAVTLQPNGRFFVALGLHQLDATNGSGNQVKADPLAIAESATGKTLGYSLANSADAAPALKTMYNNKNLTDTDLYGVKNTDRQVFLRMQYIY